MKDRDREDDRREPSYERENGAPNGEDVKGM